MKAHRIIKGHRIYDLHAQLTACNKLSMDGSFFNNKMFIKESGYSRAKACRITNKLRLCGYLEIQKDVDWVKKYRINGLGKVFLSCLNNEEFIKDQNTIQELILEALKDNDCGLLSHQIAKIIDVNRDFVIRELAFMKERGTVDYKKSDGTRRCIYYPVP